MRGIGEVSKACTKRFKGAGGSVERIAVSRLVCTAHVYTRPLPAKVVSHLMYVTPAGVSG